MTKARTLSSITTVFTALMLLFGIGLGHSLVSARSMHEMEKEATSQCQSVCPPMLNETQKTTQVDEDDAEPNPFPLQSLGSSKYASILSVVIISALTLSFLRRRPPDLATLHANYRF